LRNTSLRYYESGTRLTEVELAYKSRTRLRKSNVELAYGSRTSNSPTEVALAYGSGTALTEINIY